VVSGDFEQSRKVKTKLELDEAKVKRIRPLAGIDFNNSQVLTLCGKGMLIGDSDVLNDQNFTFSLKCVSQKGALLVMTKQQFLSIRSKNHAWMNICLEAYNKQQIHEYQDSALKESHLML
jgi:CRP-like cAMP-binding protein